MSKSFEENYKAQLSRNIPDLWDRIEAEIDLQMAAKPQEKVLQSQETKPAKKVLKIKWNKIMLFATPVLAVCFLGVILLPVSMFFLLNGAKSSDFAPMAEDSVMENSYDQTNSAQGDADAFLSYEETYNEAVAEEALKETVRGEQSAETTLIFVEVEVLTVSGQEIEIGCVYVQDTDRIAEYGVEAVREGVYRIQLSEDNEIIPQAGKKYEIELRENDTSEMTVFILGEIQ